MKVILDWGIFLLISLSFFSSIQAYSQSSLILNGGFEELNLVEIPSAVIDGQYVEFENKRDTGFLWSSTKHDHVAVNAANWNFTSDSTFTYNAWFSDRNRSKQGKSYGLITPFMVTSKGTYYVKNVVGQTTSPLVKGVEYDLSFWVKPFSGNYFLDSIEVLFSDEIFVYDSYVGFSKEKEQVLSRRYKHHLPESDCIIPVKKNKDNYTLVRCKYIAKGGETYVYIGNLSFSFPKKYKKKHLINYGHEKRNFSVPVCQYAIDEVKLLSPNKVLETIVEVDTSFTVETVEKGKLKEQDNKKSIIDKTITLDAHYFETDSFRLKEKQVQVIRNLAHSMNPLDIEYIEIIGHTDNSGSLKHNQKLSELRALSVKEILQSIHQGLVFVVFDRGSNSPLSSNESALGRSMNRRVEIIIHYR